MERYVATFHTHVSALLSARALAKCGVDAEMAPVPRQLSSSCGTCVFYQADEPYIALLDEDTEAVYRQHGDREYETLYQNR